MGVWPAAGASEWTYGRHAQLLAGAANPPELDPTHSRGEPPELFEMSALSGNVAVPEASFDMVLHRHQLSAWSYT